MSIAAFMKRMRELGAPAEAIEYAVEQMMAAELRAGEIEAVSRAERESLAARRQADADRQWKRRNGGMSRDITGGHRTSSDIQNDVLGKEGPTTQETTTPVEITPSDPKGSSVPKGTKRTDRGTFIASDWQPSADEWAFAIAELGSEASAARQRDKFRNFWLGKSGSDGRKRDWPATWRNWVMREAEDGTASRSPANSRAGPARFEGRDSAATILLKRDAEARRHEQSSNQPDFLDDCAGPGGSEPRGRSPRDTPSQRDRMGGTGQILDLVAVGSNRR